MSSPQGFEPPGTPVGPDPFNQLGSAPPPPKGLPWKHLVLFALTVLTTTLVGADHAAGFASGFNVAALDADSIRMVDGLWYSLSILSILGAHEFGHYFACRYYHVEASLPYFLPAPLPLTGTLGAVIRIRQAIPGKRELFDIGIAGPIAGFVVAVPVLIVGLSLSNVVQIPDDFTGFELGEPLLFKLFAWFIHGTPPDGYSINLHPMAFAAWFGLLATALNLFPIGQLDGGHVAYASLGRTSTAVTLGTLGVLVVLTFFSLSWLVWTILVGGSILFFGPRHPRTADEHIPLDPLRQRIALFAVAMFVLCFTPAPIELLNPSLLP